MTRPGDDAGDPPPVVRVGASPDPEVVRRVAEALERGDVAVIPTDTVYGVAAAPSVVGATARLYALKRRRPDVPLAVLVAEPADLGEVATGIGPEVRDLVGRHWPGPLTVVARRHPDAAGWDLGGDPTTIGVRCPDHPLVRAVAARVGPVATTSANRHGEPTPATAEVAAASLDGPVAVIVDGGRLAGEPSTVVDTVASPWRILRRGGVVVDRG